MIFQFIHKDLNSIIPPVAGKRVTAIDGFQISNRLAGAGSDTTNVIVDGGVNIIYVLWLSAGHHMGAAGSIQVARLEVFDAVALNQYDVEPSIVPGSSAVQSRGEQLGVHVLRALDFVRDCSNASDLVSYNATGYKLTLA